MSLDFTHLAQTHPNTHTHTLPPITFNILNDLFKKLINLNTQSERNRNAVDLFRLSCCLVKILGVEGLLRDLNSWPDVRLSVVLLILLYIVYFQGLIITDCLLPSVLYFLVIAALGSTVADTNLPLGTVIYFIDWFLKSRIQPWMHSLSTVG